MVRVLTYKCDLCANIIVRKYGRLHFEKRMFSLSRKTDELAAGYVPNIVEKDKYQKWETDISPLLPAGSKKFSMIMPPPNITGSLHLGHALTLTIQDTLMRWNRMQGFETTWVPGLDHAGIATQVIVERKLWQEKKKTRHDIRRDAFEMELLNWQQEKSIKIKEQIKNLGALPDWNREYFTMDDRQAKAVTEAFIRLFESGLIYRSEYLINWSCFLRSAISDIEVEHIPIERRTKMFVPGYKIPVEFGLLTKFAYKLCEGDGEVIVSTTRPETMLGDVAIAVHPEDNRYASLRGKRVMHPFRQEPIPIIFDEFVDRAFGTGAVKVTPAHDPIDFIVGRRHKLPILQVIDERGNITNEFSSRKETNIPYIMEELNGMKRFQARDAIIKKLNAMGLLRAVEDHAMTIPICSRSQDVVEHLVKPQWFVNCSDMAAKAAQDVREGRLTIQPTQFEKTWFNWLENIRDWCISRQLWWGHRIPAYRCTSPQYSESQHVWVAAADTASAKTKAAIKMNLKSPNEINQIQVKQDEDVLDTWFSSALLPFSVFGWPEQTKDYSRYYPSSILETGHDILFFWVARMVMLGHALTGKTPFEQVLLHGVICDAHGRKMSKSLGNVIAPEQVIHGVTLQELEAQTRNSHAAGYLSSTELEKALVGQRKMFPAGIPQCGADALRFTLLSHNIQNHFINFNVNECHSNKLFCNKIWQSVKYTKMCHEKVSSNLRTIENLTLMDKWILSRLSKMIQIVNESLQNHDFHVATAAIKQFFYAEFCDVYVETTKPAFKNTKLGELAAGHVQVLVQCLDTSIRALAPFMPYLADEIYEHLPLWSGIQRYENVFCSEYPKYLNLEDPQLDFEVQVVLDTVTVTRRLRKRAVPDPKEHPNAIILTSSPIYPKFCDVIATLSGCKKIILTTDPCPEIKTFSDTVGNHGVVHILSREDFQISEEEKKYMQNKTKKLLKEVEELEMTINSEAYISKAPETVRLKHMKKLAKLREELYRLLNLQQ